MILGNQGKIQINLKGRVPSNFFATRKMIVKVNDYFSSTQPLVNPVPQGSFLSLVLYTAYGNSMAKAIEKTPGIDCFGIYADNIFLLWALEPLMKS